MAQAADRLAGILRRTPVLSCRALSEMAGFRCHLKAENLQETGAFKVRGALAAMTAMEQGAKARRADVVTASAGNFGQGVAFGATLLARRSLVLVPEGTPAVKRRRIVRFGGEVRVAGRDFDETYLLARELAARESKVFLPPFDHRAVIEGQGTLVRELLEEVPQLDTLVVPCGGGGLLAGAVVAARHMRPDLRIIAVEPRALPSLQAALAHGRPRRIASAGTLADGVAVREVGRLPLRIARTHVDAVLSVSEPAIEQAIRLLAMEAKQLVEGAGAVATAAVLEHGPTSSSAGHGGSGVFRGCKEVGILLTGGNIDPSVLGRLLGEGD